MAEVVAGNASGIEVLVNAADVGELHLEFAIGERVLLGEPAVGILLGAGDLPGGAGFGGGFDDGLVSVPVLILEVVPPAGEVGAAIDGGFVLADEGLGSGFVGFDVLLEALVEHGILAFEDALLDFHELGFHLRAGVHVVPECGPENGGAFLQVGGGVEEDREGVGVEFGGAQAVAHIGILGAGEVEGLPPTREGDEFVAHIFEVGDIAGLHLGPHGVVDGFAEFLRRGGAATDVLHLLAGGGADLLALDGELGHALIDEAFHGLLDDLLLHLGGLPGEPIIHLRPFLAGIEAEEFAHGIGGDAHLGEDRLLDDDAAEFALEGFDEVFLGLGADLGAFGFGDGLAAEGPAFGHLRVWIERDVVFEVV